MAGLMVLWLLVALPGNLSDFLCSALNLPDAPDTTLVDAADDGVPPASLRNVVPAPSRILSISLPSAAVADLPEGTAVAGVPRVLSPPWQFGQRVVALPRAPTHAL